MKRPSLCCRLAGQGDEAPGIAAQVLFLHPLSPDGSSFDQGDMEQALENYDICTEMLQSSAALQAEAGAEQGDVVIRLPNLHNDSVVSLEEVRGRFLPGVS